MVIILIVFIGHWYLSLFFQTFFHHRYSAHSQFEMSPFWEKFFFLASFIVQGSSYLSPYAYGILHRMHHAHTDTEKDVHSPKYDKNIFTMMWRTKVNYSNILKDKVKIDDSLKQRLPKWMKFDLITDKAWMRILWMLAYTAFYILVSPPWFMYFLLPIHFFMGPVHGAIINWFAHKYGYVNFKMDNTSKNFLPVDFLMLGESYHNNHHKFASSANFGYRWFEIDPVYYVIKVFSWLNIVQLRKA